MATSDVVVEGARPGGKPALALAFGPELALVTVVGLWASTFIVTKDLYDTLSPLSFTGVRFGLMILFSWAVLLIQSARQGTQGGIAKAVRVDRAHIPRFLLAGATGYTLYQLGFALGLERTSPFSSSLLIAMVPVVTVVLLAVLGERTPPIAWAGLGVAVLGAVVFLLDKRGEGGGTLVGDLLSLGAALAFATYGVVNRPLTRAYAPATATAYGVTAGGVPLLVICAPAIADQDWGAVSLWQWLAIAYMVILPVYVAYMLWNWAIARRGVAAATRFSLLVPVVSGILSALVFSEGFGALKLVGAALVLLGLVIARKK
jgi:drug/metabolite transporter (DMT)-like permease